jgi:hypothetical protein
MLEFALIVLFGGSAIAAAIVFTDSAVRGRNAHRRLTREAAFVPVTVARVTVVDGAKRPALRLVSQEGGSRPAVSAPADWQLPVAA